MCIINIFIIILFRKINHVLLFHFSMSDKVQRNDNTEYINSVSTMENEYRDHLETICSIPSKVYFYF